jgi:hypothetical protein
MKCFGRKRRTSSRGISATVAQRPNPDPQLPGKDAPNFWNQPVHPSWQQTLFSRASYELITKHLGTAIGIVKDGWGRRQRRIDALQPRLPHS